MQLMHVIIDVDYTTISVPTVCYENKIISITNLAFLSCSLCFVNRWASISALRLSTRALCLRSPISCMRVANIRETKKSLRPPSRLVRKNVSSWIIHLVVRKQRRGLLQCGLYEINRSRRYNSKFPRKLDLKQAITFRDSICLLLIWAHF